MTQIRNHLYYGGCLLIAILTALPPEVFHFVPVQYKSHVEAAVVLAAWLKSHRNLFVNPDGTTAKLAYVPPMEGPK